ncbi:MAG: SDR family oxidoreductase [Lachnospiraceae bacterium]|nr:SDR family oxidoreductase [Lachnospiraceae bacterium]
MKKNVIVITGGGSGMGLETAKLMTKESHIILVGRTVAKLDDALGQLHDCGLSAEAYPADISDRDSVKNLAVYAASLGQVKTVIHAAGVSPHMTDSMSIFKINALGTIIMDEAFLPIMEQGGCILNVTSMSAYMLPDTHVPTALYQLSLTDTSAFMAGAKQMFDSMPNDQAAGFAYSLSKNFAKWYTEKISLQAGKKGIRVVSISPGTFDTPLGKTEGDSAAKYALMGALGRVGDPAEIAKMMAFIVSNDASYLTGVDILYDGGTIAAMKEMQEHKAQ